MCHLLHDHFKRRDEVYLGTAKPVIVMESTSHYHLILFPFFSDAGYEVIVVNPLQSNALENINVRKIKTDKVDAYRLALLYRMNVLRRSQVPTEMLRSLRMLCRQHYELKGDITRYKNRLTALLDQTFPGFSKIFSDPAEAGALAVLEQYPTPDHILAAAPSEMAGIIQEASHKSGEYGSRKAALLLDTSEQAARIGIHAPGDPALMRKECNTAANDPRSGSVFRRSPSVRDRGLFSILQTEAAGRIFWP